MDNMELHETHKPLETTTESLKLFKNTKGYNWEIKILEVNIKRLTEINDEMCSQFGVSI